MSRATRIPAFLLAAILVPCSLFAQTTAPPAERATGPGIGVTLNPTALLAADFDDFTFVNTGLTNILVPIRLGAITLEPELGVFRFSASSSSSGFSSEATLTSVRLAVGVLVNLPRRGGLQPYLGPRIGRHSVKSTDEFTGSPSSEQSRTDWAFSGVLGAQYYFSPHFSLGGEAQLTYLAYGDVDDGSGTTSNSDQSILGTSGLLILRWYF